jgi:hypothetical protein
MLLAVEQAVSEQMFNKHLLHARLLSLQALAR